MFKLTDEQENILNNINNWYYNNIDDQFLEYTGPAGSGKTMLLRSSIDTLKLDINEDVLALSVTGSAVNNLRSLGFTNAATIQKGLYIHTYYDQYNNQYYDKKRFIDQKIKLVVVDEAQSLSTSDIHALKNSGIKAILCGDSNQWSLYQSSGFGLNNKEKIFTLTKVLRQAQNSDIVTIANNILNETRFNINEISLTSDIQIMPYSQFKQTCMFIIPNYDIIISNRNVIRNWFNFFIKEYIYGNFGLYIYINDRIVCKRNYWKQSVMSSDNIKISLTNGLIGRSAKNSTYNQFLANKGCLMIDFIPDIYPVTFKNLEISLRYLKDLYILYLNTNIEDQILNEDPIKIEEISTLNDEIIESSNIYSNHEIFDYAYCLTTAFTQGREFRSGIFIQDNYTYKNNNEKIRYNELIYTALTRFTDKCLFVIPDNIMSDLFII